MADGHLFPGDYIDDRFELVKPLGKGAFGAVWRGLDHHQDQAPVAVKVLYDRYRTNEKMLGRFKQEAHILEKLAHPGIAAPIAWSGEGDIAYLAMEFIDGETLDVRFANNASEGVPVPAQGVAWLCDRLCEAVQFAHDNDVVHRDMKPKNVMVNRRGEPPMLKVLDFGIAKMLVGSQIDPTTAGRVLGSVLYISPEQVLSKKLDHRADIFSIATIMFELIALRRAWAVDAEGDPHPFHIAISGGENNSHVAVLKRIARGPRPSVLPYRPDLSPAVDEVLHRAMSINADDRYASVTEFAVALRTALLAGPSIEDSAVPTLVDHESATLTDADNEMSVPPDVQVMDAPYDELATESAGHVVPERIPEPHVEPELEVSALPPALQKSNTTPWVWGGLALAIIGLVVWLLQ
ncbi:MAG: serine/threonine-protein kinase [Deltaproteobacteria bacterium]|jgi:serine/threonine protein kinase